ncbi:hypothetical protein ScPMuIL_016659 [Solemya velum]
MASRLFSKNGRVTMYVPNLRAAVKHFRTFSSAYDNHQHNNPVWTEDSTSDTQTVWPDKSLGPFGPQDKRFPLPVDIV